MQVSIHHYPIFVLRNGQLTSDPHAESIAADYDGADRPIHVTVTDPGSGDILKERRIDYAPNGQVARTREILRQTPSDPNPLEVVTQLAYDTGERLVQTTDPLNRVTLRGYDDHGRPSHVQDAAGNVVNLEYDLSGNLIKRHSFEIKPDMTSEAERIEVMGYDTLNRVISSADPLGHATTMGYDEEGHVLSVVDALTHKTTYGYDERGRRLSMVDAVGNKTGGTPSSHTTQWSWDRSSKLKTLVDANAHTTTYGYDTIGRLTSITYADGKVEHKSWNGDGTVATATDPNGSIATFTYAADDQPTEIDYTRGTGITLGLTRETYAYDKLGRLLSAWSDGGVGGTSHTTARTYDSFDRMLTEGEDGAVLTRAFDVVGNPTNVMYPGSSRKFIRTFDALDRVSRLEEDLSGTHRLVRGFTYFGFNRVAAATATIGGANLEADYVYDAARRLTNLTATNKTTSTDFVKAVMAWADDDLPISVQRIHEGSRADVFAHDEDHRLTLAGLSQAAVSGVPDPAAPNRQNLTLGVVHERTNDALTLSSVTTTKAVTPNLRYGYTSYGAVARTYDASGNLTGRGSDVFKYDARNRLVEADLTGGTKLEYGYDALGRRVEKKKTISGTTTPTAYLFDGWNAVQETRGGALFRENVFAAGLDSAVEYRIFGTPNHDYEIFRDATGSTAAVVTDTAAVQLFKYLPFGKGSILAGTTGVYNFDLSTATTSSFWQGLDLDPDLGWYYARNRWYDPDTGSFTSTDPLGYPDSANPYVWGAAGPWAHDPLGLAGEAPQIGWLYRVEGVIDGERVSYVGSTVQELRQRFSRHKWEQLMRANSTRIERTPVFGNPNVEASARGTLRGASSEAVRGPEQKLMERTRAEVQKANSELPPEEKPGRMLNEINAAKEPETLIERHGVTTGKAETVKTPGGGLVLPVLFVLQVAVDSYNNAMAQKEAQYGKAPYRLLDEGGEFTLAEKENCLVCSNQFYKVYVNGPQNTRQVEITRDEAMKWKGEAEAIWGTLDWKKDFVPGVMNRELPKSPTDRVY